MCRSAAGDVFPSPDPSGYPGFACRPDARVSSIRVGETLEELERAFDPSIPDLLADEDRLVQVFLNLARNGLQALEGAGVLRFETRMTLDHRLTNECGESLPTISVAVEDDGPGIPADLLDKVTTPLFTTRSGGTGLGLAVARHWVALHDGVLRIESGDGHGTKVRVSLPIRRATPAGRAS